MQQISNTNLILLLLATWSCCVLSVIGQQFYNTGNDVRCARLWDNLNYEGGNVDCDQNERKTNLGTSDCKAQSVFVKNGCTLTVYDKTGCTRTIERSSSCLWGWNKRITAACCECDGCNGEVAQRGLSCARLYQNVKCSSCSGFRIEINPMDSVPHLQIFNNEISSLIVKPGCQLQAWEGQNYTGRWEILAGPFDSLITQGWNDRISSLKCTC